MQNDSLGFMNYQSGELGLSYMVGALGSDSFTLRLNSASPPMAPTDNFGSYVEPSPATGYAPISSPLFGIGEVEDSWTATLTGSAWFLSSPAHETVTVYGWWLQDDTTETIIAAGNLSPAFVCPPSGQVLTVSPIVLTLGSCSTSTNPYSPLLYASMSAADSTSLSIYTPEVGPVGTAYSGDWIILSDAATDLSLSDDDQFVWNVEASDCLFTVEIYLLPDSTGGSYPNICLRQTDKSHLWIVGFGYSGSSLDWSFFVNEGSGYSEIASGSVTISADQWLLISVLMVGPNIVVCAGPDLIISYTSATFNQTATSHGLRNAYPGSGTARSQWRYVTVQPLSYVP